MHPGRGAKGRADMLCTRPRRCLAHLQALTANYFLSLIFLSIGE